jgi:uncharacterized protein YukE
MTLDPSLPGLLLDAARAVDGVRQNTTNSARTAAAAGVPGWQGVAAARHQAQVVELTSLVNRAVAAVSALETGLGNAAVTAGNTIEAEARAAQAAAAAAAQSAQAAQGNPVYGPPWPGAGTGYPTY